MRWKKLGVVVPPAAGGDWACSHAAVPYCLPMDDRHVVILFSARDRNNRSRPARVIVDLNALHKKVDFGAPLLDVGTVGTFDDSGVMPTWAVPYGDGLLIYYVGWNRGVTIPFQNAIGAAFANSGAVNWRRVSEGPLIARSRRDPYFVASCAVERVGDTWRMWYLTCREWFERDGRLTHRYHIRQMESADLLEWNAPSVPAIDFAGPDEYAISRPSTLREAGRWHMWYSMRGDRNRIGYAVSDDAGHWIRRDDLAGISPSESGWDSEMIGYPHVFRMNGALYMAYNGNNYGASGIGLAVLESGLD